MPVVLPNDLRGSSSKPKDEAALLAKTASVTLEKPAGFPGERGGEQPELTWPVIATTPPKSFSASSSCASMSLASVQWVASSKRAASCARVAAASPLPSLHPVSQHCADAQGLRLGVNARGAWDPHLRLHA